MESGRALLSSNSRKTRDDKTCVLPVPADARNEIWREGMTALDCSGLNFMGCLKAMISHPPLCRAIPPAASTDHIHHNHYIAG